MTNKICPECNSNNINEDDFNDFITGIIIGIPAAIGIANHVFKCVDCGYQWEE